MSGSLVPSSSYGDQRQDFRLPSRAQPPARIGRRLAQEAATEMAYERHRADIQLARVFGTGDVAHTAVIVTGAVSRAAEEEARRCPEERARVDAIADVTAAVMCRLVQEMAR